VGRGFDESGTMDALSDSGCLFVDELKLILNVLDVLCLLRTLSHLISFIVESTDQIDLCQRYPRRRSYFVLS
jgi:hypothetical protein